MPYFSLILAYGLSSLATVSFALNEEPPIHWLSPRPGAQVFVSADFTPTLEIQGCQNNWIAIDAPQIWVNEIEVRATPSPYKNIWWAKLPAIELLQPLNQGTRLSLRATQKCKKRMHKKAEWVTSQNTATLREHTQFALTQLTQGLAQNFLATRPISKQDWDWEDAVFHYGSMHMAAIDSQTDWCQTTSAFVDRWNQKKLQKIDRSDRCAPALALLPFQTICKKNTGQKLLDQVLKYVRNAPRNKLGTLDHLGTSWLASIYPQSIWVDSLMMYGVLALDNAKNDPSLFEFAVDQPVQFANVLQSQKTGLFKHAYLVNFDHAVPRQEAYWLRGNAWVFAALVKNLEALSPEHPKYARILESFKHLAEGLLTHQMSNGLWDTIINDPGYAYSETSGSVLVAYALAKGFKLGLLEQRHFDAAKAAFYAVTARLENVSTGTDTRYSMKDNSDVTNALPKRWYRRVKLVSDQGYGVGSYLMAASLFLEENK